MSISLEEVEHVAKLSRLKLSSEELKTFQTELNSLLSHFQGLEKLEIQEDSFVHLLQKSNRTAPDHIEKGFSREQALRNAPLTRAGLFMVLNVLDN